MAIVTLAGFGGTLHGGHPKWHIGDGQIEGMSVFMKKYVCQVCGYEYDPAVGDPDSGIAAGTAFEDLPDDWVCPICGVGKDSFVEV